MRHDDRARVADLTDVADLADVRPSSSLSLTDLELDKFRQSAEIENLLSKTLLRLDGIACSRFSLWASTGRRSSAACPSSCSWTSDGAARSKPGPVIFRNRDLQERPADSLVRRRGTVQAGHKFFKRLANSTHLSSRSIFKSLNFSSREVLKCTQGP